MIYQPWIAPQATDRAFFEGFRKVAEKFHFGSLSRLELEKWHELQLSKVLNHAKSKSRFYGRHLSHVDISNVSHADLTSIPFTTKEDLRDNMLDLISGDIRDSMYFYQTSGTTGPSTPCPRGVKESLASNFNAAMAIMKILKQDCGEQSKPALAVLVPNELHAACKTYADVCKDLGIMVLDAWPPSPAIGWKGCVDVLNRLQVEALIAPPAILPTLAKVAKYCGIDPSKMGVKSILCLGEICSPSMKRNIKSIWNANVYDFVYGSQEAFIMAAAEPAGGLVPCLPNYIFEIIDPATGESCPQGYGELCVTCLVDGVKPLIRYRTGDIVDLSLDQDQPSVANSRIKIYGRSKDSIQIGRQTATALELEELALGHLSECVSYQYVLSGQASSPALHLQLELLQGAQPIGPDVVEEISGDIERRLGLPCKITFETEISARAGTGSWVSWKAARFIDETENSEALQDFEDKAARTFTKALTGR